MIDCGSQAILCDMPIHFDNYKNCSHRCKYCFASFRKGTAEKQDNFFDRIEVKKGAKNSIINFINGKRQVDTNWCDWDIPIHWGAMSDPFQPAEQKYNSTFEILKILAETKYPVVISTKGKLCVQKKYLDLLKECNIIMQISCVSKMYDNIEKGAPSYKERIEMIDILSKNVKRVIVRCQPYMPQVKNDVIRNSLKDFSNAGAYGVIFEGMKYIRKPINSEYNLVKVGSDLCYEKNLLKQHFEQIRNRTHELGMKFFVGENRLRNMGDSLCCCGCSDIFKVNEYNCNHLLNGDKVVPTELMKKTGTGRVAHAIDQGAGSYERQKTLSFEQFINEQCELKNVQILLGKK